MKIFTRFILLLMMAFSAIIASAQNDPSRFNNTMRSNGRIYVVVAVVVAILLGLFLYLLRLEKKITKLEKEK